jgi:hypothetical protein
MNNLAYFWQLEDGQVRGDPHDGIATLHRGSHAEIYTQDGTKIPVATTEWTLRIPPDASDTINVFCMYALRASSSPVPERVIEFGDSALVITNPQEFMDRVLSHLRDNNIQGNADLVEYVPNDYAGEIGPFRKLETFRWQSEWRLVCYAGPSGPRTLSLGPLEDIADLIPTSELNKRFRITR